MIDIFKQADINIQGDFIDISDTLHIKKHSSNPETYFESQVDFVLYDYDGHAGTSNDQIKIIGLAKFRVSKTELGWLKKESDENASIARLAIYIDDLSEFDVLVGTQAEEKWVWPGMTYLIPLTFFVPSPVGAPIPILLPTTVNVGTSAEVNIG